MAAPPGLRIRLLERRESDKAAVIGLFRAGMLSITQPLAIGILTRTPLGAAFWLLSLALCVWRLHAANTTLEAVLCIISALGGVAGLSLVTAYLNVTEYIRSCDDMTPTTLFSSYCSDRPRWRFWVAENKLNGTILGTIAAQDRSNGTIEIHRVSTLSTARRQGVASALLSTLEQWAKEDGVTRIILSTSTSQPAAIAMYTRSGYAITSVQPIAPHLAGCGCSSSILPGVLGVSFEKLLG